MKNTLLLIFGLLISLSSNAQLTLREAQDTDHDSLYKTMHFNDLGSLYYLTQDSAIKLEFEDLQGFSVFFISI